MSRRQHQTDDDGSDEDAMDPENAVAQYCARLLANFKVRLLSELQQIVDIQERQQKQRIGVAVSSLEAWLERYFKEETSPWVKQHQDEIIVTCTNAYTLADDAINQHLMRMREMADAATNNNGTSKQAADQLIIDSLHNTFDAAYNLHRKVTTTITRFLGFGGGGDNNEATEGTAVLKSVATTTATTHQDEQQALIYNRIVAELEDQYFDFVVEVRKDHDENFNVLGIPSMSDAECSTFISEATVPPFAMTFTDDNRSTVAKIRHRKLYLSENRKAIYWPQCFTSYFLYMAHMLRAFDLRKRFIENNAQRLSQETGVVSASAAAATDDVETPALFNEEAIRRMFEQQAISEQRSRSFLASAALDSDGKGGLSTHTEAEIVVAMADATKEPRTKFQNWVLDHAKFFYSAVSGAILNKMDLYYDAVSIGPFDAFNEADSRIAERLPNALTRNGYMSGLAEPAHLALVYPGLFAEFLRFFCSPELAISVVRPDLSAGPPLKYDPLDSIICPNGQLLEIDMALDQQTECVEFRFFKASVFAAIAPVVSSSSSSATEAAAVAAAITGISDLDNQSSAKKKKKSTPTNNFADPLPSLYFPADLGTTKPLPKSNTVNNISSFVDPTNQQLTTV